MRDRHILASFFRSLWAIHDESRYCLMRSLVLRHAAGVRLTSEQIDVEIGAAEKRSATVRTSGAVAVIPVYGAIVQRLDAMTDVSGGTSTEALARTLRQAMEDPNVGSIVFDIDSPGGSVSGVPELADVIFKARGQKPMTAVSNTLMASAAYWAFSGVDEIVVSPSSDTGSIGVFSEHYDFSKAYEMEGISPTIVRAGKYKAEFIDTEPLADEAKAELQRRVDECYDMFTKAVARGRGVSVGDVRKGFGEGRVLSAKDAVASGVADKIGTLDEVIARLSGARRRGVMAEVSQQQREAEAKKLAQSYVEYESADELADHLEVVLHKHELMGAGEWPDQASDTTTEAPEEAPVVAGETHEHASREVFDAMASADAKREEPLEVTIVSVETMDAGAADRDALDLLLAIHGRPADAA